MLDILKGILGWLLAFVILGFAFERGVWIYDYVVHQDDTSSWYMESLHVTCLQTLDPTHPAIFCLPGDRTKESK